MRLHGLPQAVIAKEDGWPRQQPFKSDALNVAPGERWELSVLCDEPGLWAFDYRVLTRAEAAHGMFGMVTVLIVELLSGLPQGHPLARPGAETSWVG